MKAKSSSIHKFSDLGLCQFDHIISGHTEWLSLYKKMLSDRTFHEIGFLHIKGSSYIMCLISIWKRLHLQYISIMFRLKLYLNMNFTYMFIQSCKTKCLFISEVFKVALIEAILSLNCQIIILTRLEVVKDVIAARIYCQPIRTVHLHHQRTIQTVHQVQVTFSQCWNAGISFLRNRSF
jgi:hypothetical protein